MSGGEKTKFVSLFDLEKVEKDFLRRGGGVL